MSIQTIVASLADQPRDPAYYAGRADAYDEHTAGADVDTLEDRFDWMTDPTVPQTLHQLVPTAYLRGYRAYIEDLRAERHALRHHADRAYTAWTETR